MKWRHLFSNIVCGFVPNKQKRDLTRVKIRYNTRPFVKFVREYIGDTNAKITTCVGGGCKNFIVLVNSQFAFKFPLTDDGAVRALRELRITTALRKHTQFKIPDMEIIKWNYGEHREIMVENILFHLIMLEVEHILLEIFF